MAEDESVLSRNAEPADRTLAYGEEPDQNIEVRDGRDGAAQRPLLILLHGGYWRPDIDRRHMRPMAQALAAAGWTVALPEYARVAQNPAPMLADLTRVLTQSPPHIARHNGGVILIGHSAGGHLALWASAARICPTLVGTMALAPVADLLLAHELGLGSGAVLRFLGCEPVSRPDLDPRQMSAPVTPTIIVHGTEDVMVPSLISESYVAAHSTVTLIRVAGAGHFALIDPQAQAWPIVMEQLARLD
ncbi:MAG TPA: alpha/beta hydrolase [Steroidobacteraceae bacterium]